MNECLRQSGAGACWHCCMTGQHDGPHAASATGWQSQTHWSKQTPSAVGARCPLCLQSGCRHPVCCLLNTCRLLDRMHKFEEQCKQPVYLIQAGLWSSTFLHLTATICCGCKVLLCLAAELTCWGSSTSAFLPAMLWYMPKCQLTAGWLRCECQRVQGCAPNSR